jgi:hypothetical protein
MSMNDQNICDAPSGIDVDGFTFERDTRGAIIARCVMCKVGFLITSETANNVRANMLKHLDAVHRARP